MIEAILTKSEEERAIEEAVGQKMLENHALIIEDLDETEKVLTQKITDIKSITNTLKNPDSYTIDSAKSQLQIILTAESTYPLAYSAMPADFAALAHSSGRPESLSNFSRVESDLQIAVPSEKSEAAMNEVSSLHAAVERSDSTDSKVSNIARKELSFPYPEKQNLKNPKQIQQLNVNAYYRDQLNNLFKDLPTGNNDIMNPDHEPEEAACYELQNWQEWNRNKCYNQLHIINIMGVWQTLHLNHFANYMNRIAEIYLFRNTEYASALIEAIFDSKALGTGTWPLFNAASQAKLNVIAERYSDPFFKFKIIIPKHMMQRNFGKDTHSQLDKHTVT